ncbi:nuclear transport factor 2 family protein [Streptomyces sp. NPDC090080]|uniref:nuclear transport factor 2 family protein n=1 Tax=Streptomyces sp. NPDC090080 TaxID=3365939 RepID=UPI0038076A7B
MSGDAESQKNRAIVLEAFDLLFNQRDYDAAARLWSPDYIQHSSHIAPGRAGLFDLVKGQPDTLRFEPNLAMADGDYVMIHGRFSGHGEPAPWIACDVVRMEGGVLKEHWDVIESESSRAESASGLPMFGSDFPEERSA